MHYKFKIANEKLDIFFLNWTSV